MTGSFQIVVTSMLLMASGNRVNVEIVHDNVDEELVNKIERKNEPLGPRQCRTDWDPHIWVEHKNSCTAGMVPEELGCDLFDYKHKSKMSTLGRQVHWIGSDPNQTEFRYSQTQYGHCGEAYAMPDYCSRAIISELSTVYDGSKRKTSLIAGAKVLFNTKNERCSTALFGKSVDWTYQKTIEPVSKTRACWGMAQDWRMMWCSKYARCTCDLNTGDCSSHEKIQCCRDMYQLFLDDHPGLQKSLPSYLRPKTGAVTPQTARTYFSMPVLKKIHDSIFTSAHKKWLRVGYRAEVTDGFPKVFLEYSVHRTFLEPGNIFDLCKPNVLNATSDLEFAIQQAGHKHESYAFQLYSVVKPGPSMIENIPKTAKEVVHMIMDLIESWCK